MVFIRYAHVLLGLCIFHLKSYWFFIKVVHNVGYKANESWWLLEAKPAWNNLPPKTKLEGNNLPTNKCTSTSQTLFMKQTHLIIFLWISHFNEPRGTNANKQTQGDERHLLIFNLPRHDAESRSPAREPLHEIEDKPQTRLYPVAD